MMGDMEGKGPGKFLHLRKGQKKELMEDSRREDRIWRALLLIFAFSIPAFIMLILFIINRIYPFGDRSFLFSDMWHQYMPFFTEFIHKIKAGEGLSYSYMVGIGSNFLALYVYYLASPLHWLAFLVPESHLMEFMSYLVIVKAGLCSLTFYIYLRGHFRRVDVGGLFFSCFYALSGFMAAYNWNIMWLDCVVLLPLILLGLERLVKEGRCTLYCVALTMSILSNYYISIMICIFLVLYFLMLLLVEKRNLRMFVNFAIYSLLAGGMAAVLLVPEVLAILETDFGDMDFPKKVESYFSVLDMLARHCMAVMTERGLDHWPNIYCGVGVFLLLPLYAVCKKIPIRRRFGYLALAGVMLLGFSTNILDFIWHGLNWPDSLPARQSFIYIFLMIIMCYAAYREVDRIPKEHILYSYLGSIVFLLCVEKFVEHEDFLLGVEWLNVAFVTAYAVLLYLRKTRCKGVWRDGLAVAALIVVMAEAGINTYCCSIGTTSRSQYLNPLPDYAALYKTAQEEALEDDQVFFRMEKFSRKTKNDGTLAGFPTASLFSSTMNSYVMDLYERLGMRHSKVYYCYDGATFFTSALLNVRFLYGEKDQEEGPLYQWVDSSGEVSLFEAVETLPFGYVAPSGYELSSGYVNDALRLQNNMVQRLGIQGDLFHKTTEGGRGEKVTVSAGEDGYYYGVLTASGTSKIKVSGSVERELNDLKKGSVLYLGYLEQGDSVTLTNHNEDDDTPEIKFDVYRMDEEVLKEALASLGEEHLTDVAYDSTHVSGEVELAEDGRLILSIPYEKGWTVVLDGEEVEPATFGGTLIALDLPAGHHSLSMSYVPEGKYEGIFISLCSLALFGALTLIQHHMKKRRFKKNAVNNAGDDAAGVGENAGDDATGVGENGGGHPEGIREEENPGRAENSDDHSGLCGHGDEPEELCETGGTDSGRI